MTMDAQAELFLDEHIEEILDGTIKLLTTEEVAGLLRVSIHSVYQWRYKGGGPPAINIGRNLRFPSTGLAEWLKAQPAPLTAG